VDCGQFAPEGVATPLTARLESGGRATASSLEPVPTPCSTTEAADGRPRALSNGAGVCCTALIGVIPSPRLEEPDLATCCPSPPLLNPPASTAGVAPRLPATLEAGVSPVGLAGVWVRWPPNATPRVTPNLRPPLSPAEVAAPLPPDATPVAYTLPTPPLTPGPADAAACPVGVGLKNPLPALVTGVSTAGMARLRRGAVVLTLVVPALVAVENTLLAPGVAYFATPGAKGRRLLTALGVAVPGILLADAIGVDPIPPPPTPKASASRPFGGSLGGGDLSHHKHSSGISMFIPLPKASPLACESGSGEGNDDDDRCSHSVRPDTDDHFSGISTPSGRGRESNPLVISLDSPVFLSVSLERVLVARYLRISSSESRMRHPRSPGTAGPWVGRYSEYCGNVRMCTGV